MIFWMFKTARAIILWDVLLRLCLSAIFLNWTRLFFDQMFSVSTVVARNMIRDGNARQNSNGQINKTNNNQIKKMIRLQNKS